MEKVLQGKVAFVTGSSRGIGRAVALALAERGADVAVHGHHRTDRAAEVKDRIEAMGRRGEVLIGDVADAERVLAMVEELGRLVGRLDILINNAGYVASHRLPDADLAVIHRIIDVNLKGPFNCILATLGLLRASKGVIVNIGALNSRAVSAAGSAYAASKAGLAAMTTNLAHDLGPLGIRINAVAPPLTETDMGRWAQAEAGTSKARIVAGQRPARPEEVGQAVAFFCSPCAAYLSGETLYMGGGFVAKEATA